MSGTFMALLAETVDGGTRNAFRDVTIDGWPEGDVVVDVAYSSLNYKDGMALCANRGPIMRTLPCVPGIDLAGTVAHSTDGAFRTGQAVLATGWGLGERHWGGYAERVRLKADWLVALPQGLSLQDAMTFGTAGFTAMLCVLALERHGVAPGGGEVLVTGATGGVGSVALALLAAAGHAVVAATGRPEAEAYLRDLGAADIVAREALARTPRPLESERWAGAIDVVGGDTLASVLAQMRRNGTVAACGLASASTLATTVMPFILRGVTLAGVDSGYVPSAARAAAWARLARDVTPERRARMTTVIPFGDLPARAGDILAGRVQGRIVVDIKG